MAAHILQERRLPRCLLVGRQWPQLQQQQQHCQQVQLPTKIVNVKNDQGKEWCAHVCNDGLSEGDSLLDGNVAEIVAEPNAVNREVVVVGELHISRQRQLNVVASIAPKTVTPVAS